MSHNNYDDYDEAENWGHRDRSRDKRSRRKRSERLAWEEAEAEQYEEEPSFDPAPAQSKPLHKAKTRLPDPTEAERIDIKKKDGTTYVIDLRRTYNVEKVDGTPLANGKATYGIHFTYGAGNKYGYTQWFGPNIKGRDSTFDEWYAKWQSVDHPTTKEA